MSNDISSLLNSLYANDQTVALEKTAEDNLIAALRDEGQVEENPYASLSDAELISLLQDDEAEKVASAIQEEAEEDTGLLEKTAAEMLGGQVMAHAMVHEMGLIKTAMMNGLCRVCKESPMDTQGSSICSSCASEVGGE